MTIIRTKFDLLSLLHDKISADSTPLELTKRVKSYWELPDNEAARNQATTAEKSSAEVVFAVLRDVEILPWGWDFIAEGIDTDPVVWDCLRSYLADVLNDTEPLCPTIRRLLLLSLTTERASRRGRRRRPSDFHAALQRALAIKTLNDRANCPLETGGTSPRNAFQIVANATGCKHDDAREAWRIIFGDKKRKRQRGKN